MDPNKKGLPGRADMQGYEPGAGAKAPQATPEPTGGDEPAGDDPNLGADEPGSEAPGIEPSDTPPSPPVPGPGPQGEEDLTSFEGDMVPKAVFLERLGKAAKKRDEALARATEFEKQYPGLNPEAYQRFQSLDQFDQRLGVALERNPVLRELMQAELEGRQPNAELLQQGLAGLMGQPPQQPGDQGFDPNDPYMQRIGQVSGAVQQIQQQLVRQQQEAQIAQAQSILQREIQDFETSRPEFRGDQEFTRQALAYARTNRTTYTKAAEALAKWALQQRDAALKGLQVEGKRRDQAKPGGPAAPVAVPVSERPKLGSKEERDQMAAWAAAQGGKR